MKLGILRETKDPPDRRVPLTPIQCRDLARDFPGVDLRVQSSDIRCYADHEYAELGQNVVDDLSDCDILMGVKEVDIQTLIPEKAYLFFSHTAKEQPQNRELLKNIIEKNITLVDYEYLTDNQGLRLVTFGRWAGIVGAYNGIRAYGERYRIFRLRPAHDCHDYDEVRQEVKNAEPPNIKILITGGGRVAGGAMEIMEALNIKQVEPEAFLNEHFEEAVACRIDPWHYTRRKDGREFSFEHFVEHPDQYESTFKPYQKVTDLFIACHYWDPRSPLMITTSDTREPDFHIRVIADVSCDIGGPIASTFRASTIEEPFYGFYPRTELEMDPFDLQSITVMAVDNLPGELPRDASTEFGNQLMESVMPALLGDDREGIIDKATIVRNGELNSDFAYLTDYLEGR